LSSTQLAPRRLVVGPARAAARCATPCDATTRSSHGNRLLLLSWGGLTLSASEVELISVASCAQDLAQEGNFCRKLTVTRSWVSSSLDRQRSLKITIVSPSRCLNAGTSRGVPSMCIFSGASCATTSTLMFYVSFRPRHATSSRISEPSLVLLSLSSSSSVLFFAVVFDVFK
jgi:hypothetical protein